MPSYADYRNIEQMIARTGTSCFNSADPIENYLVDVTEMIRVGRGAMRPAQTVYLSWCACYLVIQNADPGKEIMARPMTRFTRCDPRRKP